MSSIYDLVVIGAGPAGLSAACVCREWELKVLVLDEFMQPGGRLLGQLHQEPDGRWWNGLEEANQLVERADARGVELRMGVSVHHIERTDKGFVVHAGEQLIETACLLVATGAAEAPSPIPGWTLPGVMSIGAAQVMTNVHRVRVGRQGIIVGVNVLSAAIARELQLAGVGLHCMALPAASPVVQDAANPRKVAEAMLRIAHLAPAAWMRLGSKFAGMQWVRELIAKWYPKRGLKLWGMPIHLRKAILRINGEKAVQSVTMCDITVDGKPVAGTEQTMEVDFVCIAGGLYPLVELVALLGCSFRYIEELGGHVPLHNERMETELPGLFVAGNITGIESAKVATAQGTLAGLSIVRRLLETMDAAQKSRIGAVESIDTIESRVQEAMIHVKQVRAAATIQFHPGIERGRQKLVMEMASSMSK